MLFSLVDNRHHFLDHRKGKPVHTFSCSTVYHYFWRDKYRADHYFFHPFHWLGTGLDYLGIGYNPVDSMHAESLSRSNVQAPHSRRYRYEAIANHETVILSSINSYTMKLKANSREKSMRAKYSAGNRVRIKSPDFPERILDPKILQYENMIGEIIDSTNIVAFIGEPSWKLKDSGERITIYHYTVRINDQITLHDVLEDCLEIIQ